MAGTAASVLEDSGTNPGIGINLTGTVGTTFNVAQTGAVGGDLLVKLPLENASGNFGTASAGVTKTGSGTMVFEGGNVYTGPTNINGGIINYQNGQSFGTSSVINVASGATAQVQGGVTGGSQAMSLNGPGAANATGALESVSGANSYAGLLSLAGNTTISVDAGSLNLSNGGTINYTGTGSGANLTLTGAGAGTLAGGLNTQAGGVTQAGSGSWALTGASTYTGATLVQSGTLILGGAGSVNDTSGITVSGSNAEFVQNSSVATTPTLTLTQGGIDGTGVLGQVNVADAAGNFIRNGYGTTSTLTIGILTFNGAATLSLNDGSATTPDINVTGLLTTGAVNATGAVTINVSNLGGWTNGVVYDLVSYLALVPDGSLANDNIVLGTVGDLAVGQTAQLVISGTEVGLTTSGGNSDEWTGLDSNHWVVGATGPNDNWRLQTGLTPVNFTQGDDVLFDDTATSAAVSGTVTVNVSSANVNPALATFNNNALNYVLTSGSGFGIAGTAALIKSGTGTLTIENPNTFTGVTTVSGGIVNYQNGNSFGVDSAITVESGASVQMQGGIASTGTETVTLSGSGAANATGVLESVSGNNSTTTPIVLAANNSVISSDAGTLTLSGTISGANNGVTTTGTGTIVFAAPNSFTGPTTVNEGILNYQNGTAFGANSAITVNSGATVQVQGNITGGGQNLTLAGSGAANATGALESVSGNNAYSGPITLSSTAVVSSDAGTLSLNGAIGGSGGLTIGGVSEVIINTNNSYTGNTIVNSGTLQINSGNNTPGALAGSPNVIVNPGATLLLNNSNTLGFTANEEAVTINDGTVFNINAADHDPFFNTVNMTGGLIEANGTGGGGGGGGAFSWNANSGPLLVATSDATGHPAVVSAQTALQSSGEFEVNRGTDVTGTDPDLVFTGAVSKYNATTTTLTIAGSGNGGITVFEGANTITGLTTIDEGIVNYQNGTAFATDGALTVASGATAQMQGGISGGSQALTISGAGDTPLGATGALESVNGNNSFSGGITLGAASTISVDTGSLTLNGAITGASDALTIAGAGKLTLNGANTYSGVTTINGDVVNLGSSENPGTSGPLGASAAANPGSIVLAGGTLQYSNANQFDYSGRFSAAASQQYNIDTNGQVVTYATPLDSTGGELTVLDSSGGSGALIINSNSTYTGPTTVESGNLVVSGSLNGTSGVSVYNLVGTLSELSGTGVISSNVSIGDEAGTGDSSLLVPGAPSVQGNSLTLGTGVLAVSGTVNIDSDGEFVFDLNSTNGGTGSGASELLATKVSLDPASQFTFIDIATSQGALNGGLVFDVIATTNGLGGEFANLAQGSELTEGPNTFIANYTPDDLQLVVVPEPQTWGMIILGLGMLLVLPKLRKSRTGS